MTHEKQALRRKLRASRRAHVVSLDQATKALLFIRPPRALLEQIPSGASIGVYAAMPFEAPANGYAQYFFESGHEIALPRFEHRGAAMEFARISNPHDEDDLETGPFGLLQPSAKAQVIVPEVVLVPLLGFTADGARIGQGGGHYDRFLANHSQVLAIGLGWDVQLLEHLPTESHDQPLRFVVTPTRLFGAA